MLDTGGSPVISVVVCTHNRAALLGAVLDSLCRQAIDPTWYEIIVVDNGSSDDTAQIVSKFSLAHPNIRYCFEATLGHSTARNRGWQESASEYVAYIDDDAIAPENWLSTAMVLIQRDRPGVLGGPYFAYYRTAKPPWFKDEYASSRMGESVRPLGHNEYLSATNIFVRRDLLERIGGFDRAYGGIGTKLGYAEETELQQRLRKTLPAETIRYEPGLYVFHLVKPAWMSIRWRMRSFFIMGRYHYRFLATERLKNANLWQVSAMAFLRISEVLLQLFRGLFLRDRTRYPHWKNYVYENGPRYFRMLGSYCEHVRYLLQSGDREEDLT